MQVSMDPKADKAKGVSEMQEAPRPEVDTSHRIVHTGYGVAYEREDVTFIPLEKIYLNLKNPRYYAIGQEFEQQKQALDEITDIQDVRTLRKSIKAIGLQRPLEVHPYREGYKVIDGNRRRAALQLVMMETGQFTEVPANVFKEMNDDSIGNYLLVVHGVSAQKSWSPIAKWEVPYRYYHELKYSTAEIEKITGIPQYTIKAYMNAMDYWTEYSTWLIENGISDPRKDKRLSSFRVLSNYLPSWLRENKREVFQLLSQGKLEGSERLQRYTQDIFANPLLKQILLTDGLAIAGASLEAMRGVKRKPPKGS